MLGLGTSYGQRLRRVAEVTLGVAVGVFVADLFVLLAGSGAWQLAFVVTLSMSVAFLLDAGRLLVTQAAVQSIVVVALLPDPEAGLTRWSDAVIGGVVALAAATVVPRAPLRRPRLQAAVVMRKSPRSSTPPPRSPCTARSTRRWTCWPTPGAPTCWSGSCRTPPTRGSPWSRRPVPAAAPRAAPPDGGPRRAAGPRQRNTRVLVRRAAVAAYRREPIPDGYGRLCADLAACATQIAEELEVDRMPVAARPSLLEVAHGTAQVERTRELSAEVVLAQVRSITADLLRITGLGVLESTDAIPPAAQS